MQTIDSYIHNFTKPEPNLLLNLIQETTLTTNASQMLTGRIVGRLLKLLVTLSGASKILEIGTFTGYSALSMAEALPAHGKLLTCEINPNNAKLAQKYFNRSQHGHKITLLLGPALETIQQHNTTNLDLVFIDADKKNYPAYYQAVLPKLKLNGLIIIDNALWKGKVLEIFDNALQKNITEHSLAIHKLNQLIYADQRVENVLLPVRDGINLLRKIRD